MSEQVKSSLLASTSPKTPPQRKLRKTAGAPTPALPVDVAALTELVEKLRELGVTEFQTPTLHLKLAHVGPPPGKPDQTPQVVQGPPQDAAPSSPISDEDMLFWSVEPLGKPKEPIS